MASAKHLIFRATPADHAAVATIADALRSAGRPFVTRTEAVRHALAVTAATLAQPKGAAVCSGAGAAMPYGQEATAH